MGQMPIYEGGSERCKNKIKDRDVTSVLKIHHYVIASYTPMTAGFRHFALSILLIPSMIACLSVI